MNIIEKENSILLRDLPDFNSTHIFECGQCFRWDKYSENSYIGVVNGKVLVVEQRDNEIEFHNTNIIDFKNIWTDYFDIDRDYGAIKEVLKKDNVLNVAIKHGWGIRILNQPVWETLISYIISANNRIPMIKRAVKRISEKYGEKIWYNGEEFYSFPTLEQLKNATVEELTSCGVGFRAKYIKGVIDIALSGKLELKKLFDLTTETAREELIKLPGVGPKIADCVLLFSVKKSDAFPTDVWVKRVMEYFYSDKELKLREIQTMAKDMFGNLAGFAQEYLFYYARDLQIGK